MQILKPCPFCGGEPYFLTPVHVKGTAFDRVGVECKNCGANPYAIEVYEGSSEEDKKSNGGAILESSKRKNII